MQPPTLMFNLGGVNFEEFCDFIEQHPEELPYDVLDNIAQGYNADFFRKTKSFIFLGMHHLLEELRKRANVLWTVRLLFYPSAYAGTGSREHDPSVEF